MRKTFSLVALICASILNGCGEKEYSYKQVTKDDHGIKYEAVRYPDGTVFMYFPKAPEELAHHLVDKDYDKKPDNLIQISARDNKAMVVQRDPSTDEISLFERITFELYR